ncbi:hypothetical protein B0H14DRAFT_3779515 [Mycena olivaceomarginata]|nr:hypothetical protein B0H14DRAFT_3779515 [Mycena olivaceomarginata]
MSSSTTDAPLSRMREHRGNVPILPKTKYCTLCPAQFTRTAHLNRHLRSRKSQTQTSDSTDASYAKARNSLEVICLCGTSAPVGRVPIVYAKNPVRPAPSRKSSATCNTHAPSAHPEAVNVSSGTIPSRRGTEVAGSVGDPPVRLRRRSAQPSRPLKSTLCHRVRSPFAEARPLHTFVPWFTVSSYTGNGPFPPSGPAHVSGLLHWSDNLIEETSEQRETEKDNTNETGMDKSHNQRRQNHNAVEQRRRNYINQQIRELEDLIAPSFFHGEGEVPRSKRVDVKRNRGKILRKSVEYVKYLRRLAETQAKMNRKLEEQLKQGGSGAGDPVVRL